MNTLSLEHGTNYKLVIRSDNESILQSFQDYLYTWDITKFRVKMKNGETFLKEQKREAAMYTRVDKSLYVDAGLLEYVAIHVSTIYKNFGPDNLKLEYRIQKQPPLPLLDKWRDIFATHPRGESFAENQVNDFPMLMNASGGILEVFTGYGKTEMMLACIESMLEHTTGNIVILIPDLSIEAEIKLRSKKYGVPVSIHDWTQRVNLIAPVGFLRSKKYDDECREWLKSVTNVITDECHHLSAMSWGKMFDDMPNVVRSYGFSASVDVSDGTKLTPGNIDIKALGPKSAAVIAKCGSVKVSRKLPVPVSLLRVNCSVTHPDEYKDFESWQEAFDQTIVSDRLASVIARIFERYQDRYFFIPIHKKESGFKLYQGLMALMPDGIYWGDDLYVDGHLVKPKTSVVEYLKAEMARKPRRCIIGTRFEGYDIPALNAFIPLTGTSHRMTVQPAGRAARREDCLIVLINDRNNPITVRQNYQRRMRIEKEFKIVSNKYLSM